ncbi:hypothetical protein PR048_002729 [Dryococelus australis]|uniref:Uncharacterized protein n=1 Tax=Dryococelus australis TaxID=614101 RepID=A0ABQ9INC3_9NEOP|nr:hypothetical protein PR048_002729 [Dryococelus australis]
MLIIPPQQESYVGFDGLMPFVFVADEDVDLTLAEDLVKVYCVLHNFVRDRDEIRIEDTSTVEGLLDMEPAARPTSVHESNVRDTFAGYFVKFRRRVKRGEHGMMKRGETGDTRENPPTSDIVRHGSHMLKSGSNPAGNRVHAAQPVNCTPAQSRTRRGNCALVALAGVALISSFASRASNAVESYKQAGPIRNVARVVIRMRGSSLAPLGRAEYLQPRGRTSSEQSEVQGAHGRLTQLQLQSEVTSYLPAADGVAALGVGPGGWLLRDCAPPGHGGRRGVATQTPRRRGGRGSVCPLPLHQHPPPPSRGFANKKAPSSSVLFIPSLQKRRSLSWMASVTHRQHRFPFSVAQQYWMLGVAASTFFDSELYYKLFTVNMSPLKEAPWDMCVKERGNEEIQTSVTTKYLEENIANIRCVQCTLYVFKQQGMTSRASDWSASKRRGPEPPALAAASMLTTFSCHPRRASELAILQYVFVNRSSLQTSITSRIRSRRAVMSMRSRAVKVDRPISNFSTPSSVHETQSGLIRHSYRSTASNMTPGVHQSVITPGWRVLQKTPTSNTPRITINQHARIHVDMLHMAEPMFPHLLPILASRTSLLSEKSFSPAPNGHRKSYGNWVYFRNFNHLNRHTTGCTGWKYLTKFLFVKHTREAIGNPIVDPSNMFDSEPILRKSHEPSV